MLDRIIRNGSIIDGTGSPRYRGDVGIKDGKIVALGEVTESSQQTIDADGCVVAPGIVDMHTHLDGQIMWEPGLTPSSIQGVTTIIGGNCGFGIAPIDESTVDYVVHMLSAVEQMPIESLEAGLNPNWRTFGEWTSQIEGKSSLNFGFLAAHSTIRRLAMGDDFQRPAIQSEVDKMKRLLEETMTAGALGFSSSWNDVHADHKGEPVPSRFSGANELTQLASVLKGYPATILAFQAGSRPRFSVESVDVMAAMSVAAGARLNWNVLTVGVGADKDAISDRLASSDYAAARGGEVWGLFNSRMVERLVIKPLSTATFNRLAEWPEIMALPVADRVQQFKNPDVRARLGVALAAGHIRGNFPQPFSVDYVESPKLQNLLGKTLAELAAQRSCSELDVFFDICIADEFRSHFGRTNPDLDDNLALMPKLWDDPRCVLGGSDAGAHVDINDSFKIYLELIGPHVRERKLTTLERAVHLITDRPARLNSLVGRGRFAVGWQADIMIFDPNTVAPGTTYINRDLPSAAGRLYADPIGMHRVLVNGIEVVIDGKVTGKTPGDFLRSGRDQTVAAGVMA